MYKFIVDYILSVYKFRGDWYAQVEARGDRGSVVCCIAFPSETKARHCVGYTFFRG